MFCKELVRIFKKIDNLTEINFDKLDNFLGKIGENNLFTYDNLRVELTQKNLLDKIVEFLIEEKIIEPYQIKCNQCGNDNKVVDIDDNCLYCESDLLKENKNYTYKIIANLTEINKYKDLEKNKINELNFNSFNIIKKKIDRIINKKELGTILFFDIANSSNLKDFDISLHSDICKLFNNFIKELIKPYFFATNGLYLKSEGDSIFLFFEDIDYAKDFMKDFKNQLFNSEYYQIVNKFNKEVINNQKLKNIYIKIYCASSTIQSYTQEGILKIDFPSMESFIFIKRIEKESKNELIKLLSEENKLIPFFIISRDDIFNKKNKLNLGNYIQNYENSNLEVYYYLFADI